MTDEEDAPGLDPSLDPMAAAGLLDVPAATPGTGDEAESAAMGAELGAADEAPGGAGLRLSAEESEALLDAIRTGAAGDGARSAALGSADEPLRRATRRADESILVLETALAGALVRSGEVPASMEHEPSSVLTYETLAGALDKAAAVWLFHAGDAKAPLGVVVVGATLAAALVERRLGAPSGVAPRALERAPSAIERRVLEPLARELVGSTAHTFLGPETELALVPFRPELEPVSRFAPCLRLAVRTSLRSGVQSEVLVAFFANALTPPSVGLAEARPRVMAAVSAVEVVAIAVLGSCRSTVRDLLALSAGSVLRLDAAPERPIELRVDGVPVLRGMPVVKDGNMAIEVRT